MAFRFKRRENVEAAVRRMAGEQLVRARAALDHLPAQPEETVHDIRTRMKRLRALVRLMRDALGQTCYQQENHHFRDIARLLAPSRDQVVRLTAFEALINHQPHEFDDDTIAQLRLALSMGPDVDQATAQSRQPLGMPQADTIAQVREAIEQAMTRVDHWAIGKGGFNRIAGGLKRAYADGRGMMRRAYERDEAACFHQWRKRVKDLWYQLRVLRSIWPNMIECYDRELNELAEILGRHQDIDLLHTWLLKQPPDSITQTHRRALLTLVEQRARRLRRRALLPARHLYAEKPKAFVQRMAGYWRAWRRRKR